MKKILKLELSRALFNINFILVIAIGLIIILVALKIDNISVPLRYYRLNIFGGRELLNIAWFFSFEFFIIFAPLFAAYAYSDSYIADRLIGYVTFVKLRSAKNKYIISKAIANAIIGGLTVLIPILGSYLIIRFFLSPMCFTVCLPDGWIISSSLVTVLIVFTASFLFGAAFATFSLVLSTLIHNRYMVIGFPLFLFFAYEILIGQHGWSFVSLFTLYYWQGAGFINTFDFLLHLVHGSLPILILLGLSILILLFYLLNAKENI